MAQQTNQNDFETHNQPHEIDFNMSQYTAQHTHEPSYKAPDNQAAAHFKPHYDGPRLLEQADWGTNIDANIDPRLRDREAIDMSGTWTGEAEYIPSMQDLEQDISSIPPIRENQTTWRQGFDQSQAVPSTDFQNNIDAELEDSQSLSPDEMRQRDQRPYHANATTPAWPINRPITPPSSDSARLWRHQWDAMVAAGFGAQQHHTLAQLRLVTSEPQTGASAITYQTADDGYPTPTSTRSALTLPDSPHYTDTPPRVSRTGPTTALTTSMVTLDAITQRQHQGKLSLSAVDVQHSREENPSNVNEGQTLQPLPLHHPTPSAPASVTPSQPSYTCDGSASTFPRKADWQHDKAPSRPPIIRAVLVVATPCSSSRRIYDDKAQSKHQQEALCFFFPCRWGDCKHYARGFKRKDPLDATHEGDTPLEFCAVTTEVHRKQGVTREWIVQSVHIMSIAGGKEC